MQLMYITLACACLGMVVALQRVSCRSRLWLSAFLTFLAAYLGLILLDAQAFHISPKLYFLLLSIVFLPGPLLLGYVGHISTRRYVGAKDFVLCALPLLVVLLAPNLLGGADWNELASIQDYQAVSYIALFNLLSAMAGLQMLSYLLAAFILMLKLRGDWASYQSKTLPKSWYKMLQVLLAILLAAGMQVVSAFVNPAGNAISIGDVGFVFIVVYFIILAGQAARGCSDDEVILQREDLPTVALKSDEEKQRLAQLRKKAEEIRQEVEQQQLFLQDELSLASMAEHFSMSTHKLSEAINTIFQLNFYDFINEFRIEYAADLLLQEPKRAITDIYYSAGFTTKSTFYSSFKKAYACTPSEYRKKSAQAHARAE